jgi:predicted metal-dependent phosphotriesterase family hydrolase
MPAGITLGAGTVLEPETAHAAIDAGASYLVSPTVGLDVIERARRRGVAALPGAFTPTEILRAWRAGADAVKLFPASVGGPAYLRAVKAPLAEVPLVPTGGVGLEEIGRYLYAGALAVGLGGPLVGDAGEGGDLGRCGGAPRRPSPKCARPARHDRWRRARGTVIRWPGVAPMSGFVRTVLGDVASEELGPTYAHEHLLTCPMGEQVRDDPDLVLYDEQRAAAELRTFVQAGGRALVEASTAELGRDLAGLRRLARRTGVHVVAATGHVCEQYWRGALDLEVEPERALVDGLVRELTVGMDGTDVRAGVVKVGSSLDRVTDAEARVIRAAAAAQRQTGAPITTHTTAGTAAMAQVRALERAGADLSHVCVGHLDRRLVWEDHLALARTGVFLGYDCVGKEQYQPDAERVRFILRLVEAGHGRQVLLAGDMARRRYLGAWGGGPGYRFILREFLPRLCAAGLDDADAQALVVANPASFLTWRGG